MWTTRMLRTALLLSAACSAAIAPIAPMTHTAGALAGAATPSLTIAQTKVGNVFLDSETPSFAISTPGSAISWNARDLWNREVASGKAAVRDGGYRLSLTVHETGWFRLVVDAYAAGAHLGEEATTFAVLPRATAAPGVDSPFGYLVHTAATNPAQTIPLLAEAGITAVRSDFYWSIVERSAGVYDFSEYDQYLQAMHQLAGASAELILGYTNPLYDGNLTPYDDAGLTAFARYAAASARHYRDVARSVEVYNEYKGPYSTGPCARSAACYARMLKYTYPAVKSANQGMTVIGGAFGGADLAWLEQVFKAGAMPYLDAVAFHPYTWTGVPEDVESQVASLDALIRRYNGGNRKPIYLTEVAWSTAHGFDPATQRSFQGVDEATQASYLLRGQVLLQSAPTVERTFVYDFINDGVDQSIHHNGFGSLHSPGDPAADYTPKPAYVAGAVLRRQLLGAVRMGQDSAPGGVRSYHYRAGAMDIRVMWAPTPARVTLHAAGPVTVTDEMGNRTAYQNGTPLSLSGEPVYVSGTIQSITHQ